MNTIKRLVVALGFLMLSCSSQVTLTARTARFPVCITESVYDSDYTILAKDRYQQAHHFQMHFSACNINKYIEIGSVLSDTLTKYQGDAIHNLRFKVRSNKWPLSFFKTFAWIFTLGFIMPSYCEVEMEGDVMQLVPPAALQSYKGAMP